MSGRNEEVRGANKKYGECQKKRMQKKRKKRANKNVVLGYVVCKTQKEEEGRERMAKRSDRERRLEWSGEGKEKREKR